VRHPLRGLDDIEGAVSTSVHDGVGPTETAARPVTPMTVALGDVVLMMTDDRAAGSIPVDQLAPTVQSLLVAPVQV
jgi:hypothetical protein